MCEKYNLEKCVLDDCKRTWTENDFDNVNFSIHFKSVSCDCLDKLIIILHVNQCIQNNVKLVDYKQSKMDLMFALLLKNGAQNCLPCGHQWYSYSCQKYVKNVRQLLENVVL